MKEEKINFSSILSQEKSTSSFQCHKLKPKCLFYNIFYDQLSASASWDQSDDSGLTQRITVRRSTKYQKRDFPHALTCFLASGTLTHADVQSQFKGKFFNVLHIKRQRKEEKRLIFGVVTCSLFLRCG